MRIDSTKPSAIALIHGLYNHLSTCDDYVDFTDEDIAGFMEILSGAVEMCVTEPVIIEQSINGSNVFVKASGQVEPMILNAILGIDLDYETVGGGKMLMVTVSGTAVVVD